MLGVLSDVFHIATYQPRPDRKPRVDGGEERRYIEKDLAHLSDHLLRDIGYRR